MTDALTRPTTGTTLFVEQDRRTILMRRVLVGTCTLDEWNAPARRQAAINGLWKVASNIRSEGDVILGPAPVTLYRAPLTGTVLYAHIQTHWIDAKGNRLLVPPSILGLIPEKASYARWAEGPRLYVGDHEALPAPALELDRQLQEVRHRNRWLRELIDPALEPSRDPIAQDAGRDDLVDFRVRAICSRSDVRVLTSKQTGDAAAILADGEKIDMTEIDPAFTVQEA